jgi:mannose-6-phosphate isomerase-like protein (cupin superfamily)
VVETMEIKITREKPPVLYDLDDYRRGLRNRPNDAEVTITPHHRVNLWTIQAGQAVPLHEHSSSECVLIVMAGRGEYRQGNQSYDLKKEMLAVAPPGTVHSLRNTNSEPLIVLTIEGPGPFDAKVLEPESADKFY